MVFVFGVERPVFLCAISKGYPMVPKIGIYVENRFFVIFDQ